MRTDYHGSSSPNFTSFGRSILSMKRDPVVHSIDHENTNQDNEIEAFQRQVTQRFHDLSLVDSNELLSVTWVSKLLDVFLCCQEEFKVILFNNKSVLGKQPMEKLVSDYFEKSVKGLDVCNAIRDGIEQIRQWQKQLEIVLCALGNERSVLGEGQIRRAKKALIDLAIGMLDEKESNTNVAHRNRSFGRYTKDSQGHKSLKHFRSLSFSVSRSWSACKQLQAIGNNIVVPKSSEIIATNGLAVVVYTMSNVFLFVMWALVAAIPCQDRGLQLHFNVPKNFIWGAPIVSLHERILDEVIRLTPSFISHVLKPGPGRVTFLTRPELVYKFFRWAGSQKGVCKYKYFHDLECYVHVIEVLCLCKDFVKVKVVFDEVKDKRFVMDLKCANLLIRSFGNVGMVEELLWVWREMKRSGVEPSLFTFNFLLNGLVNSMFVESAEQVFEVMEKGVVKPDVVSFNTMIKGYCKIGRTSKAVEVFGKMEEANVERDKISYLTLMQACYADGDYDSCLKLYNEMEEKGVEVPEHGYSLVIGGLCKDGKPMEGYTLFENMIQKGCKANVAMYTSLMDACAKSGHIDEVIRIFERMNRDGFKPDEVTYVG